MWYVFFLVVIGVTGVFIWDYRRKAARREAASKERFDQIFKARTAAPVPESASAVTPVAGPAVAAPTTAAPAATTAPALAAKERFLGQPETLIYLLLKAGLPDHEIFANVSLASMIGVPGMGYEREQQLRRLSRYQVDFVVCDKSMRIIAAIEVESAAGTLPAGERSFREECLKSGGIRLVRLHSTALPRRDEIRKMVCGSVEPGGKK